MQLKEIKELMKLLNDSDINKLKIKNKDFQISLSKEQVSTVAPVLDVVQQIQTPSLNKVPTPVTETILANNDYLKSPMVGTFYEASSPKSQTFVKKGDMLKKGDTIGIIEAMKIMNEIEAEFDCKIIEILVKNEQPVEFDMPLYKIEKL